MKVVDTITVAELGEMAQKMYGSLVKAVADIEKKVMVVDAEMHADEEAYLLEKGSKQENLWGFNLYPTRFGTSEFVEFDSMINIKPRQKNMDRGINDKQVRDKILQLVAQKIAKWALIP